MHSPLSRRKARVDSAFHVAHPGDPPLLVCAGRYLVDEFAGEVALRLQRSEGETSGMFVLSTLQFQELLDQRRLVFVSW